MDASALLGTDRMSEGSFILPRDDPADTEVRHAPACTLAHIARLAA